MVRRRHRLGPDEVPPSQRLYEEACNVSEGDVGAYQGRLFGGVQLPGLQGSRSSVLTDDINFSLDKAFVFKLIFSYRIRGDRFNL